MTCACGLPMSRNPHPDAGKPAALLEVGAVWVCIPCTVKSRHKASQMAFRGAALLSALGIDGPWPVADVLDRLLAAHEHLHEGHDCDHHGYEVTMAARDAARQIVTDMRKLLATR